MLFKPSCKGFKSRESPGHSKTDILLIPINTNYVFCRFRINIKYIALHKFFASFIGMLISMTFKLYRRCLEYYEEEM